MTWKAWKQDNGLLDFTDLIEYALRDVRVAPGNPRVIIGDEAQDLNKLQLSLIRQWGGYAEHLLISGDDDQTIYGFTGATPDAFLNPPIPDDRKRFLKQSWRVPETVHAFAKAWVAQLTHREPKEYLPRPERGAVRWLLYGDFRYPDPVLHDAEKYLAAGKSVMFLTACSHQLQKLISLLRSRGIPFHNPYRVVRGDWNPLSSSPTSISRRMLSFLRPREDVWENSAGEWTGEDLRLWVELLKVDGVLRRGKKNSALALPPDDVVSLETLDQLFEVEALDGLMEALQAESCSTTLNWLLPRLVTAKKKPARVPRGRAQAGRPIGLDGQASDHRRLNPLGEGWRGRCGLPVP